MGRTILRVRLVAMMPNAVRAVIFASIIPRAKRVVLPAPLIRPVARGTDVHGLRKIQSYSICLNNAFAGIILVVDVLSLRSVAKQRIHSRKVLGVVSGLPSHRKIRFAAKVRH